VDLFNQLNDKPKNQFEKIQLKNGEIWILNDFLSKQRADKFLNVFLESINWKQEEIKLYGKVFPVPRKTAWYGYEGFNYSYSGINCNPETWTSELFEVKSEIEGLLENVDFNSVLLNLYRDGKDSVSWHADNEKELGINPTIASVSLGAIRRFDIKHKEDTEKSMKIELLPGSLIIMRGEFQHYWLHQIPKQLKVTTPRVNLTFRTIKL
jgi:alkylated DNA repair dioxygenase AlkB